MLFYLFFNVVVFIDLLLCFGLLFGDCCLLFVLLLLVYFCRLGVVVSGALLDLFGCCFFWCLWRSGFAFLIVGSIDLFGMFGWGNACI